MARNPLAQFALTAVAGVLAATLIAFEGDDRGITATTLGRSLETNAPSRLPLEAEFMGVAEDDGSLRWQTVPSSDSPSLSLRIRRLEEDEHSAAPRWRVAGQLAIGSAEPSRRMVADLAGTLDWRSAVLRLDGSVAAASPVRDRVRVSARIVDFDLQGVVLVEHPRQIAVRTYLR